MRFHSPLEPSAAHSSATPYLLGRTLRGSCGAGGCNRLREGFRLQNPVELLFRKQFLLEDEIGYAAPAAQGLLRDLGCVGVADVRVESGDDPNRANHMLFEPLAICSDAAHATLREYEAPVAQVRHAFEDAVGDDWQEGIEL